MIWSWGLLFCTLGVSLIHAFFIRRMRRTTISDKWTELHDQASRDTDLSVPGVSVIVCAKNEAARLDNLISEILQQNYADFELLIVDDHSKDHTQEILTYWTNEDSRVRNLIFNGPKASQQGKKAALSYGIQRARYDLLLLTDADCVPSSRDWISGMTAALDEHKSIVLGFGGYLKKPCVLNALIRYETTLTAGLYLGQAMAGQPYMGVGRNLAYRKAFFYAQNGFKSHEHIPSGDDDLLINQGATAKNTSVMLDSKTFTWSLPKESWRDLFRQKRRHQSTAHFYRWQTKLILGLYSGSILLFYSCLATASLLLPWNTVIFAALVGLFIMRSVYLISQLSPVFRKFQAADLRFWIPLLEPLLICLQLFIFVWNRLSKPTHWN